jgi:trimeric autotransporter adhesin
MLRRWFWHTFEASWLEAIWNAASSGRRTWGGPWHWPVALAGVILLSGLAGAQTANVSFTIVNGYPVNQITPASDTSAQVSPQSTPAGQPYTTTITSGTGGNWLTDSGAISGTAGSSSFTLAVSASANTLAAGQYTATVTVSFGYPSTTGTETIDATLNVDSEASLTVSGTPALSGGAFTLGPHYIQFTTPGSQVLNVATASSSTSAPATPSTFVVTQTSLTGNTPSSLLVINGSQPFTTTGTSTTVPVTLTYSAAVANKLAPGTYGGTVTVTVTETGVSTSPQSIAIPWTLVIDPEPVITTTPSSIAFNVVASASASGPPISVSASQNIPISVSATSTPAGWLSVTSAPAAANGASIMISANTTGLQANTYTGSVVITSASASNSPYSIPVTLTVLAPAISSLSPSSVTAGAASFPLTVSGSNFVNGSQIVFGGTTLATTFVNSGSLTATVNASQVATAGPISVTVFNPGGVTSAAATFTVSSAQTATPVITPPLQSSLLTATSPTLLNIITSGTNITGFLLYINGNFNVGESHTVTWKNTVTNVSTMFTSESGIQSVTATQIIVLIPSTLFSTPVTSAQLVDVTVTEQFVGNFINVPPPPVTSNVATFLINPPMASLGPALATGTVGTVYSQSLFTGGTGAFTTTLSSGTLPPGL